MENLQNEQQAKALKVLKKYEKKLRQYEGVYDVGLGYPISDNKMVFDAIEILVYVHKKKSDKKLKKDQLLPTILEGISVDVIESNPIEDNTLEDAIEGLFNPLLGGIQIGNSRMNGSGTLGIILSQKGNAQKLGLTNWHVIKGHKGSKGNPITQPAFKESNEKYTIGNLHRWNKNLDCAVFEINEKRGTIAANTIFNIPGKINQLQDPFIGMKVMKSGAKTGVTNGIVSSISANGVRIRIVPNPAIPSDNNEISDAGDSGSVWVTDEVNKKAVALHWGGDKSNTGKTEFAMANSLPAIFDCLDLVFEL